LCSGDLGQSFDSNVTLAHYESNLKAQAVLFVGDLTYADNYPYHDNARWDTWGRFVERNLAYQPWIWTAGNHDIDFAPELVRTTSLCFSGCFSSSNVQLKVHFVMHTAG
jgi:metallophosphoesterase superfamily enzyme